MADLVELAVLCILFVVDAYHRDAMIIRCAPYLDAATIIVAWIP